MGFHNKKTKYILLGVAGLMVISYSICQSQSGTINASNLTNQVKTERRSNEEDKNKEEGKDKEENKQEIFEVKMLETSLALFKEQQKQGENQLMSPLSILLALGMTENGADGETLAEFEKLCGGEGMNLSQINEGYYDLSKTLTANEGVKINNSIWIKEEANDHIEESFLAQVKGYFASEVFAVDFSKEAAKEDINNWVNQKTEGLIPSIVDQIKPDTTMYLINTLLFDQKWAEPYKTEALFARDFTKADGSKVSSEFMSGTEAYIGDEEVDGFIKSYRGNQYSFVGILPKEGMDLNTYIKGLEVSKLKTLLASSDEQARVSFPKFKIEDQLEMKPILEKLGLRSAFTSDADFSKMSKEITLFISSVLHKTYIEVDTEGTKAAAVTKVEMTEGCIMQEEMKEVILDRPFLFMIIDNKSKLPLFIGSMADPTSK
ncbi:MAG: serpin family protein [Clostridium sp.]|nr:serpin family protein [Clostridium sp.]